MISMTLERDPSFVLKVNSFASFAHRSTTCMFEGMMSYFSFMYGRIVDVISLFDSQMFSPRDIDSISPPKFGEEPFQAEVSGVVF